MTYDTKSKNKSLQINIVTMQDDYSIGFKNYDYFTSGNSILAL
jgi:hypothetical protein